MAEFKSIVTMDLEEYKEMLSKLNIYEEILEVMTTPDESDSYEREYYSERPKGYSSSLNSNNVMARLSRKSKTALKYMLEKNRADNFLVSLGEFRENFHITYGYVTHRGQETPESDDISPEGMNDRV